MFKCTICQERFDKELSFRMHIYQKHSEEDSPPGPEPYSCYYCDFQVFVKRHLSAHIHGTHLNPDASKIICIFCNSFQCTDRNLMIEHYQSDHEILLREVSLPFDTIGAFNIWKYETEQRQGCRFHIRGGTKRSHDHSSGFYPCSRSAMYEDNFIGKKIQKKDELRRISGICPASVNVTIYDTGSILVKYVTSQVWQSNGYDIPTSHKHIALPQNEMRKQIVRKPRAGGMAGKKIIKDPNAGLEETKQDVLNYFLGLLDVAESVAHLEIIKKALLPMTARKEDSLSNSTAGPSKIIPCMNVGPQVNGSLATKENVKANPTTTSININEPTETYEESPFLTVWLNS